MNRILYTYYHSPIGELVLGSTGSALCLADWRYRKMRTAIDKRVCSFTKAELVHGDDEILEISRLQLDEYFQGNRKTFDLPLLLAGTPFQVSVWEQLLLIPYGKTMTFRQLAELLGNPEAVRAVASANGANALSIIVPCHRIIGLNGDLTGYAGGLKAKQYLLRKEVAHEMIGLFI